MHTKSALTLDCDTARHSLPRRSVDGKKTKQNKNKSIAHSEVTPTSRFARTPPHSRKKIVSYF